MSRPNVCWITLDSVRADHTSLDGYYRDTTPRLQALADEGLGFPNCITHGKSTLPSTGSIMSGYPPGRHTLGGTGEVLPENVRTVPQRFADAGYNTAALSRNSFFSESTELSRGFDRFQWLTASNIHEAGLGTLLKFALNVRSHSAGLTTDTAKHATPFVMNEIASDWLRDLEFEEDPFFLYCHYNEPHRPYYPPNAYLDRYTDDIAMHPRAAAERSLEIHRTHDEIVANGCNLSDDDWDALHAMYDAEIAYTDEMIGRLVEYLRELDLGETIVVVTADHGELFGEHGLLSHKFVLHDALLRVPMIVSGLDVDLAVDEDDQIQHCDVMKTVLAEAGADTDDHMGRDLRQERPEYTFAQRGSYDASSMLEHNPEFDTDRFYDGVLSVIRTPEFKFQTNGDRSALLELPDEETDVSGEHPQVRDHLESELTAFLEEWGAPVGEAREGEFSDAVERQLSDLGYM